MCIYIYSHRAMSGYVARQGKMFFHEAQKAASAKKRKRHHCDMKELHPT